MSLLMWSFMAGLVGTQLGAVGVVAFAALTLVLAIAKRKNENGLLLNEEYAEMWLREIIKRLFKNNAFLNYATAEDEYVVGGRIVHIPQPGARPTVTKNRNSYPATAVRRTDSDITYNLDEYTTAPSHLPYKEIAEISYDKLSSILQDHFGYLIQDVADDLLYKWTDQLAVDNIVYTTGEATAVGVAGQTGNRKAMTDRDLKRARLLLNTQNIPQEGRIAIIESNMLDQLTNSLSQTQYRDFSRTYDAATGTIGTLYGFNIIERSSVVMVQGSGEGTEGWALDIEGVVSATDNVACLAYHPSCVSRALGERKLFNDPNRPEYYGDLNSALLRAGARRRRSDDYGVIAIVQGAAGEV